MNPNTVAAARTARMEAEKANTLVYSTSTGRKPVDRRPRRKPVFRVVEAGCCDRGDCTPLMHRFFVGFED
jgi:hypothetical protein